MDFGEFLRFNAQREAGRLFEVPRSMLKALNIEHRTFFVINMERRAPSVF